LTQLAGDLPRYQSTISEKIQSIRETTAGRGTLERASGMLKDLGKELDKPTDTGSKPGSGSILAPKTAAPLSPLQVEVRQPDPGALESLRTLISPASSARDDRHHHYLRDLHFASARRSP
jgi:hypothetical protein